MIKDSNNIYYLFSTAAQSIATFIGLLIAGYTLVLSMMDATARVDETLIEVFAEQKRRFHRQLMKLSIATATTIIGCFIVLFLNGYQLAWLPYLAAVVFIGACGSIVGGVWFVIGMINPEKYKAIAKDLAREVKPETPTSASVSRGDFLEKFIQIEQLLRNIWRSRTDGLRLGQRQGMVSFREMLEVLYSNGVIGEDLFGQLLNVSRHRNLVVHGQVDLVDPKVVAEAESAVRRLTEIKLDEVPVTKEQAVERLRVAGFSNEASELAQWRDSNGNNWGWDGWIRTTHPHVVATILP
jgi:hypothetical protein